MLSIAAIFHCGRLSSLPSHCSPSAPGSRRHQISPRQYPSAFRRISTAATRRNSRPAPKPHASTPPAAIEIAQTTAPATVAGRTATTSSGNTYSFGADSRFTRTGGSSPESGTYTYLLQTLDGAVLRLVYTSRPGTSSVSVLVSQTATTGRYYSEIVTTPAPPPEQALQSGSFTLISP